MITEVEAFVAALHQLGPIELVPDQIRQRRRMLAELYDAGPSVGSRFATSFGGVQVVVYDPFPHAVPGRTCADGVLLYAHGGGWVAGDTFTHDGVCRTLCATTRLRVISIDYRRPPEFLHPHAVHDVLSVARVVAASSPKEQRILLGGDSSGAHIVTEAALSWPSELSSPTAAILIQPACDSTMSTPAWRDVDRHVFLTPNAMAYYWRTYLGANNPNTLWDRDLSRMPRTYVLSTSLDPSADEAAALTRALHRDGVDSSWQHIAGYVHGCFTLPRAFPSAMPYLERMARSATSTRN